MIIDGKQIKDNILKEVKEGISKLDFTPVFCDVLVGDDPVSLQYVNMKAKIALSVGIDFHRTQFLSDISTKDLVNEIDKLNKMDNICGLIVQLPLPKHIDTTKVLDAILPRIDVDCLSTTSREAFYKSDAKIIYPTALACMEIIDSLCVSLVDKNIVVLGQGMLVGRPVTELLRNRGLKVSTINKGTEDTQKLLASADLIISAIGQGKYLTGNMIKKGAIVIDAGTSESDSGIIGDVDFDSVFKVASYISKVPGGVGPVTVAMLLKNILTVAQTYNRKNIDL